MPGATVQRAVHADPTPQRTTSERTTSESGGPQATAAPAKSGSVIGGALQRLVQRRPVRDAATTSTPSTPSPTVPTAGQIPQRSAPTPQSPSSGPSPSPSRSAPSRHSRHNTHNTHTPQSVPPARAVPVVRPHPPVAAAPGATVVPVQRMPLPVVPDPAGPPPAGPAPGGGAPLAGPPALSVRVPPRPHTPASGPSGTGAGTTPGRPPTQAQVLQRAAAQAGITGVPVKAVPPKGTQKATQKGTQRGAQTGAPRPVQRAADDTSGFAPTSETPADNATNTASRISGAEIEELARRLLDPVSRLIRADMRRGRERAGRLHDGRR
ncbi:hypothetical protein [Streptomyces arboris]|uniref:hypothetical protein n=1 Tax=Streptomyces arboris TaxID=2600619 RepID=UPI00363B176C